MRRRGKNQKDWMKFRFALFMAGCILSMTAIIVQAYRIQLRHAGQLQEEAEGFYQKRITVLPTRGSIFDRNGNYLAISILVDSVYARPKEIADPEAAARRLAPILGMSRAHLKKRLASRARFVWLKRQVVPTTSARLKKLDLPGIGIVKEARRFYPNRGLAGQLLGFVGVDGEGLEGVEFKYDELLSGKKSKDWIFVDARGRRMLSPDGRYIVRKDGNHLVLTIDMRIQHLIEKHLQRAVEQTKARRGMAVVMDPETFEILAMANVPAFNPNSFLRYPPGDRRNFSVTDNFEPGSTFKAILVAAALEEGIWKSSDIIFCENGTFTVANKTIHDSKPYGWLTLLNIMKVSSNIGAAKVALSMGAETLYRYAHRFGFGIRTGVGLPGESKGRLRPPQQWSAVDLATIAFGQGISATALQICTAFATLANHGRLMKPYIVKEIVDAHGKTLERGRPLALGQVVSPRTARSITRMLVAAVQEGGTGVMAALPGFLVAGKTGTAQKPDLRSGGYYPDRYIASFVGYVPAKDPRLCILVVLDEPKGKIYGGQIAAPVFRDIARDALGTLGVAPLLARNLER